MWSNSGYEYQYSSAAVPRSYDPDTSSVPSSVPSWSGSSSGGSSQSDYTLSRYNNEFRMPDECSESSAPSAYTAVSSFAQATARGPSTVPPSRRMLCCEFRPWTGCQQTFRLDEVDLWIRHTEEVHLKGQYPAMCICWYCDDFDFSTQQSPDAGENFDFRMRHIAGHMMDGYSFDQRRPDFHFLDHVYNIGVISLDAFHRAQGQSEGPTPTMELHPLGWRPERQERYDAVVETAGRRRRSRNQQRHRY